MFRLLFAMGTLALELATMASEGVMAATLVLTGMVVTTAHLLADSQSFHKMVNQMTGCDLPEVRVLVEDRRSGSAEWGKKTADIDLPSLSRDALRAPGRLT